MLCEEYRHLGWCSVLFLICGILTCFSGIILSPIGITLTGSGIIIFGVWGWKRWYICRYVLLFFSFFVLGYGSAFLRGKSVAAPVLDKPLYNVIVSGIVEESKFLKGKQDIVLSDVRFLNEATLMPPVKIKLKYDSEEPKLLVGSNIVAQSFLRPPGKQVVPNGYYEGRSLWFQKIGAVGKIDTILSIQETENISGLKQWLERVRIQISQRVQDVLPDEEARVIIPLIIGEQGFVTPRLYDIFRSAGITHILSVSGFHLSLLTAFVFLLIRGILSLFPSIAERISPKKIAAVVALLFSMGYIGISGLQIPAIRSFIMISIVLIAVLFDRNALSVRSVSVAAVLILVCRPEMILNIGFQLSFLAVLILVTLYQPIYRFIFVRKRMSLMRKILAFIGGFIIVDLLTSFATTPFIIYHFQTYAFYGSIGNLLTATLLSFWVMPLLLFAVLCLPIGCDIIFFKLAGWGISYVIMVCDVMKNWPHAVSIFPSFRTEALLIIALGIIVLCLMRTRLRFIGVIIIGIGIIVAITTPRPDMLIGDGGQTIAIRKENKKLFFLQKAKSDFTARIWMSHNGEEGEPEVLSKLPSFVWIKGKKIAFTKKDCHTADVCFLPDLTVKNKEFVFPLYQWETRAVYIHSPDVRVITVGQKSKKPMYMN